MKKSNKWDNPIGKNSSPMEQARNVALMIKNRLETDNKNVASKTSSPNANREEVYRSVEIEAVSEACRRLLTTSITLNDIMKRTGARIEIRGFNDVTDNTKGHKGLHLHVASTSAGMVHAAVDKITKVISSLSPSSLPSSRLPPTITTAATTASVVTAYVQDKVYIGLDNAPTPFKLLQRIQGDNNCYLEHIEHSTGARVVVRGMGSGCVEVVSGREAFEPIFLYLQHNNIQGLKQAVLLAHSLIQKVQQDYSLFLQKPVYPGIQRFEDSIKSTNTINYPLSSTPQPITPHNFGFAPLQATPAKRPPLLPSPSLLPHTSSLTAVQNYYKNYLTTPVHKSYKKTRFSDYDDDAASAATSDRYSPTAMLEEERLMPPPSLPPPFTISYPPTSQAAIISSSQHPPYLQQSIPSNPTFPPPFNPIILPTSQPALLPPSQTTIPLQSKIPICLPSHSITPLPSQTTYLAPFHKSTCPPVKGLKRSKKGDDKKVLFKMPLLLPKRKPDNVFRVKKPVASANALNNVAEMYASGDEDEDEEEEEDT